VAVRHAHAYLGTLVAEAERLAAHRSLAEQAQAAALAADKDARAALDEGAQDADLPADTTGLAAVVGRCGTTTGSRWPPCGRWLGRCAMAGWPMVGEAEEDLASANAELIEWAERTAVAEGRGGCAPSSTTRRCLSTVGAAVRRYCGPGSPR